MSTHKKNPAKRIAASLKRTIALKAIVREDTVSQISKDYDCSRTTVYNQHRKGLQAANRRIRAKWNQPMHNWALIISQLDIYFEGRLKIEL